MGRLFRVSSQEENTELIAVQPVEHGVGRKHGRHLLGRNTQNLVPEGPVIQIIDVFKGIHVQHHKTDGVHAFAVCQVLLDISLKLVFVVKAGHMVNLVFLSQIANHAGK